MNDQKNFYFFKNRSSTIDRWIKLANYITEDERNILLKMKAEDEDCYCISGNNEAANKILIGKCPLGYIQKTMEEIYENDIYNLRESFGFDKHSI